MLACSEPTPPRMALWRGVASPEVSAVPPAVDHAVRRSTTAHMPVPPKDTLSPVQGRSQRVSTPSTRRGMRRGFTS